MTRYDNNNCHIGLLQKLVLIDADETLAADTESILILSNKQSAAVFSWFYMETILCESILIQLISACMYFIGRY